MNSDPHCIVQVHKDVHLLSFCIIWVLIQQVINLSKVLFESLQRLLEVGQQLCRVVHGHKSMGTAVQ